MNRSPRVRRRTILALTGAALAVGAGTAMAAPTAPTMETTMPASLNNPTPTIQWAAATFDVISLSRQYVVTVDDLTVPASSPAPIVVPAGTLSTPTPPLINGHTYTFRVRARNIQALICGSFPLPACPAPTNGPDSATITARVDTTGPDTGTVAINGGAAFANSTAVTLAVNSNDPAGIGGVQVSTTGTFSCSFANFSAPDCPVTFAPTVPGTLAPGADGPRTISVKFRDKADGETNPCHILFCFVLLGPHGNQSATPATDSIVLDTLKPTVNLLQSSLTTTAGVPVTFNTIGSADGSGGSNDSGVDPAGFAWDFGDGTAATGATVAHSYGAAGTYTGTASVKDIAGNVGTRNFTVVVGSPAGASAVGTPVAGGLTPAGGANATLVLGKLVKTGKYKVNKVNRITITTSALTTLKVTIKRGPKLFKTLSVTGGPGTVTIKFTPKKRGTHSVSVVGGGITRTISVLVK